MEEKIGYTVQEASRPELLNRSPNWIRHAINLGRIKAIRLGRTNVIMHDEIQRVMANMPIISREDLIKR